jgi:hypothetical protein
MTALPVTPARSAPRAWIAALVGALVGFAPIAHAASTPVHLSLFHPISTNSDPNVNTNFALSIIQSRTGALHGVGLHAIVSENSGDVGGVLLTGAYARVHGNAAGLVSSMLGTSVGGDMKGFQSAWIFDFNDGSMRGLQAAGLLNFNRRDMSGIQLSGILNSNGGRSGFLQVATVANASGGKVGGLQVAGFMNIAQTGIDGVQVAVGNLATDTRGAQIGMFNRAGAMRGLQVGVANRAEENFGVPIGPVNLSRKNGRAEVVLFGSTFSAVNVGIRTEVHRFSSMLTAGGIDLEGDVETAGFLTWNYGYRFPLGSKCGLITDAGMTHVMPKKSDDPTENDQLHYGLMARALLEYRPSQHVGLFGGPGVTQIYENYGDHPAHESKMLWTLGLSVEP